MLCFLLAFTLQKKVGGLPSGLPVWAVEQWVSLSFCRKGFSGPIVAFDTGRRISFLLDSIISLIPFHSSSAPLLTTPTTYRLKPFLKCLLFSISSKWFLLRYWFSLTTAEKTFFLVLHRRLFSSTIAYIHSPLWEPPLGWSWFPVSKKVSWAS